MVSNEKKIIYLYNVCNTQYIYNVNSDASLFFEQQRFVKFNCSLIMIII